MKRIHALVEVDTFGTATVIGLIDCDVFNGDRLRALIKELLEYWLANYNVTGYNLNEYADKLSRDMAVADDYGNTFHIQWCIKMVSE